MFARFFRPFLTAAGLATTLAATLTASLAVGVSTPAMADDPPPQLTGDWGGWRTDLANKGVQFQIGYTEEGAGNANGGQHKYVRAAGQLVLGSTLDMHKLFGLNGGTMQITLTNRNGRNLSSDAELNTLQQVQEVYGRGNIWRLTQFWYEQKAFDGAVALKFGRVTLGEDFAAFSCNFQNLTFCGSTPGNLAGNYWFNWPLSQWGARLKLTAGDVYVQAGAYQVNPRNSNEGRGFYLGWDETTGALLPLEFGWTPSIGGLPGKYTATLWYDTSHANDIFLNRQGQPLALAGGAAQREQGRYGVSFQFQQQLTRPHADDGMRGLSAFLNVTQTDRRTSQTDNQIAFGMFYTGWFDSRPRDVLAVAVGRTQINPRYADNEALGVIASQGFAPNALVRRLDAEYAVEAYYNLNLHSGLDIRPNIQYIRQPGGVTNARDVVVFGLKAMVNL